MTSENLLSGADTILGLVGLVVFVIAGISLVVGGIGIMNTMLMAVMERTREIGIRKAMGATSGSIISLIMQESIFITTIAGYIGLTLGVLLLEVVGNAIEGNQFFQNPEVDLPTAIYATLALIIAGSIAGLIPALRASKIEPVVALRED